MSTPAVIFQLQKKIDESHELDNAHVQGGLTKQRYRVWDIESKTLLARAFGRRDPLVKRFSRWRPYVMRGDVSFQRTVGLKRQLLLAAVDRLIEEHEGSRHQPLGYETIDPGLWVHVEHLVISGQWGQVASQAAIYLEDKLRQWSNLPEREVSTGLMTRIFRPNGGVMPIGRTESEREGWHQLARGFAAAVRNVDTHRIQNRPDLRRYAVGVLGTASLILLQVTFEYEDSADLQ